MSFAFRLLRSFEGMTGTVILVLLSLRALAAPAVFPGDPLAIVGEPLITPFTDAALPLGTDRLGRNVLAELAHGAQASLLVGMGAGFAMPALMRRQALPRMLESEKTGGMSVTHGGCAFSMP